MIGTSLNHYQVTAKIGAGGMGEVYRARDTRLGRDVAIKVLPNAFASDSVRMKRFEQEARTLAALNHPNILVIHDVGVRDGTPYLVSELLEGQTLHEVLRSAGDMPMPARKAIDYALQMARGLAAAHAKGIVHRDLKPENTFVTRDGRVKILDFGLAKLNDPVAADVRRLTSKSGEEGQAATIRIDADAIIHTTQPGAVMGTPGYMSPEQVRGEQADHRSDIFSFGCILYDMLAGQRAFRKDDAVQTMNAILTEEPRELTEANPNVPPALERVVARCLGKNPDDRFQSAKDLAFALETLTNAPISRLERVAAVR